VQNVIDKVVACVKTCLLERADCGANRFQVPILFGHDEDPECSDYGNVQSLCAAAGRSIVNHGRPPLVLKCVGKNATLASSEIPRRDFGRDRSSCVYELPPIRVEPLSRRVVFTALTDFVGHRRWNQKLLRAG
jgi:hypothetical protein